MAADFSFIILTFNEELHLPRLLKSLAGLTTNIFVLDSGSTDQTIAICEEYNLIYAVHAFENHPKQWDMALRMFDIKTPWVIALDADQCLTPELYLLLIEFKDEDYSDIDGIYFNRKNIFQGKWIKHGGYYPKYLLKMFRYGIGYSDLNENMDHRFIVPGKTAKWNNGHLLEENLKENQISFWIAKHNRYSDLLATEELERKQQMRSQLIQPKFWGNPDQQTAWFKKLWWNLPTYSRTFGYFGYRMIIQKGFLDGRKGMLFHFMQGFWFRLVVDMKLEELLDVQKQKEVNVKNNRTALPALKFVVSFPLLFLLLYYFNIAFIGLTTPGGHYFEYLDQHFNYIKAWRDFNISGTAAILGALGYEVTTREFRLHVTGRSGFILVYSCLGYGILSIYTAFILSYPRPLRNKFVVLLAGVLGFQLLNMLRLSLIALFWKPSPLFFKLNAHELFNLITYGLILVACYYWLNDDKQKTNLYENYSA
ncbi:exosortase/archaeosortase family protein [Pedobacter sp. CAN_A7]|uniref:exosortase Y n=1 Tax=Pedobacter sp. CAN_A7 TaxID=2787722 RepID=UPI001A194F00